MDGNLRSGNQEIEGDQGSDEAIQVGASSEKSQVTGFDDNSWGSAEPGEDETASLQTSEWTDEKHSLYLNSIEASFVKQMHNHEHHMMDLRRWLLRKQNVLQSYSKSSNGNDQPSGQFKVLKRGSWEKIHFRKSQTHPDTRNESNLLSSPWIQHFRPSSTSKGVLDAHLSHLPEDGVLACEANHLHRRKYSTLNYGLATSSEVSDQNFVDEDRQKEEHLSSSCKKKRGIVSGADRSINDQVVPFDKSAITASSSADGTSQGKRGGDYRSSRSGKTVDCMPTIRASNFE
ncbi:hypothetical protein CKAN_02177600 [Cinnamomum micranthum f. kanehirae]|uniref:Cold regulated protein 27 n=1 Tax=Cinnamomum micranthum f. kanehirae TaxID=337451 RepID=A0A443PP58_9MAGN|nr:hypothetical protein CKAN_02177600 [Cinnamomum micranthum f. kanehirae]